MAVLFALSANNTASMAQTTIPHTLLLLFLRHFQNMSTWHLFIKLVILLCHMCWKDISADVGTPNTSPLFLFYTTVFHYAECSVKFINIFMAHPRIVDGGTASNMEGSCE